MIRRWFAASLIEQAVAVKLNAVIAANLREIGYGG